MVTVRDDGPLFRLSGLHDTTHFYPSRLAITFVDDLGERDGILIDELPALRRELRRAIGIGMGSCGDPSAPARGSLGGTVVRFRSDYERMVGAPITGNRRAME